MATLLQKISLIGPMKRPIIFCMKGSMWTIASTELEWIPEAIFQWTLRPNSEWENITGRCQYGVSIQTLWVRLVT